MFKGEKADHSQGCQLIFFLKRRPFAFAMLTTAIYLEGSEASKCSQKWIIPFSSSNQVPVYITRTEGDTGFANLIIFF